MKKLVYLFAFLLVLTSCSEFQKALKSEDVATKFKLGTELYDAGKYNKANRLFAQIVPNYVGKTSSREVNVHVCHDILQHKAVLGRRLPNGSF